MEGLQAIGIATVGMIAAFELDPLAGVFVSVVMTPVALVGKTKIEHGWHELSEQIENAWQEIQEARSTKPYSP